MTEQEIWHYFRANLSAELCRLLEERKRNTSLENWWNEEKWALDCFDYYLPILTLYIKKD
jgi:hypothetical protein